MLRLRLTINAASGGRAVLSIVPDSTSHDSKCSGCDRAATLSFEEHNLTNHCQAILASNELMDDLAVFLFTFASVITSIVTVLIAGAIYIRCAGSRVIQLGDGLPGAFDDSEQFAEEEQDALEMMDDRSRQSYLMAKRWIERTPPDSADTDISLSQYLTIQEKAVAAWEFTFDILQQPFVLVQDRTELWFRGSDDIGCVQTNLPLPKQKEVYYWEVKIYDLDEDTRLSVGLTTKPYPVFRLPGMHQYSVAYDSTAHRRLNQPFKATAYGRKWQRGDVIGVGYRSRLGTVFFTHNGKKLDDVVHFSRLNVFPTVGATGPAHVYVNFGQDGFVFIQANVKGWGLAPAQGSLAPPPAYGDQHDSLLLESTRDPGPSFSHQENADAPPYVRRRSSDDAHQSMRSQATNDIRTPPGSPPPPLPSNSETSDDAGSTQLSSETILESSQHDRDERSDHEPNSTSQQPRVSSISLHPHVTNEHLSSDSSESQRAD